MIREHFNGHFHGMTGGMNNEIGFLFRRFHPGFVHGSHRFVILRQHLVDGAAAFFGIALETTTEANVGLGVLK